MVRYRIDLDLLSDMMISPRKYRKEEIYLDTHSGQPVFLSDNRISGSETEQDFMEELEGESKGRTLVELPIIDSLTEFHWMTEFAEMVSTPELYSELQQLLDLSGTIKKFYSLLAKHPEEQLMWFHQFNQKKRAEAESLLNEIGICEGERYFFHRE